MRPNALARRWFISFMVAGSWQASEKNRHGHDGVHRRYVWPVLFETLGAAQRAFRDFPVFANREDIPGVRGRLKSASIESVVVRSKPVVNP